MELIVIKPEIFERDGKLWTTSREVARKFGKRHDNVIAKIKRPGGLFIGGGDCS